MGMNHFLRMPLDTKDTFFFYLDGFNYTVSCLCGNGKTGSHFIDALMMEGICQDCLVAKRIIAIMG